MRDLPSGRVTLQVPCDALLCLLAGGLHVANMPADAVHLRTHYDVRRDVLSLVLATADGPSCAQMAEPAWLRAKAVAGPNEAVRAALALARRALELPHDGKARQLALDAVAAALQADVVRERLQRADDGAAHGAA